MFLLRGVEDRTGKLRIERAGQHAFENARARIPDFDAVRELIGLRCYNAKAPNLFTPSLIRGSQAIAELDTGQCFGPLQRATTLFL